MSTATAPSLAGAKPAGALPARSRIVIIGTGFSGLAMAIRLRQRGIEDFVVLEKSDEVGGTWRENT